MENSESLANIVFARTAKGVNACKAINKELSRQLKSLLLVVDGHSPVSKFVPYLSNLLPLSEKFTELELAGYIQRSHAESSLSNGQVVIGSHRSNLGADQSDETDTKQAILASALFEIEKFIADNPALEALTVMSILSEISTFDHLKDVLPAYFELIASYDIDSASHAQKLKKLNSGKLILL
jgi:hypothetical protein